MNSVSMVTNSAPFWRAQNAATASLSVIRLIAEGYTILPAAAESPSRLCREERLGLLPKPADDLTGRLAPSQRRCLPGPGLHALDIRRLGRIEAAAMAARLEALRDDRIGAGILGRARLGEGRRAGEPGDAASLQLGDELLRKETHDRRDHARRRGEQRVTLHREIERLGIARLGRHRRTPLPKEIAHPHLVPGIAHRLRIGDPQIDLERAIALAAELLGPGGDALGRRR